MGARLTAFSTIVSLRLRGASAARLLWLVPAVGGAAFLAGRWAPGLDAAARAAGATSLALGLAAAVTLLVTLVLGATVFPREVETGAAQTLLAPPVPRFAFLVGGVLAHGLWATGLLAATSLAAVAGLELAGTGTAVREPPRRFAPAVPVQPDAEGFAVASADHPEVRFAVVLPPGVAAGDVLRVHLRARPRIETGLREETTLDLGLAVPGGPPMHVVRVGGKAYAPYAADLTVPPALAAGDAAEVVLRRVDGRYALRYGAGAVELGGLPSSFVGEVNLVVLCAAPLLFLAAAAGACGASRLGAGAAVLLVLFLAFLFSARDVVDEGAEYVLHRHALQREDEHEHGHGADHGHDHGSGAEEEEHDEGVPVNAAQVAAARIAKAVTAVVPDPSVFWLSGRLADGRAVRPADLGRSAASALVPFGVLLACAWLLGRRRDLA